MPKNIITAKGLSRIEITVHVICYILGLNFFLFIKTSGDIPIEEGWVKENTYIITNFVGTVIGGVMAFLEFRVYPQFAGLKYRVFIALKFVLNSITIVVGNAVSILFLILFFNKLPIAEALSALFSYFRSGIFLSFFLYLTFFSYVLSIVRTVSERVGSGAFLDFMLGKYRTPQEVDMVFMFLDLRSSTYLAEKLGHVKYSRFLNKCFNDLTEPISIYGAEIYQFVGDEVVLTWNATKTKRGVPFIQLYYAYIQKLNENAKEYEEKFGEVPSFKAAVHSGWVTIMEIRSRKHEKVYHGDVLNTCSRILELCSRYKKDLLVSEQVAAWVQEKEGYSCKEVENLILRGKQQKTKVMEVQGC
ncbi:adenylate/guanylate cyclase domain-containing protein [Flammeovirgaceae bacterium SG7u.111]|nr:adenylate/guanylate cyclase domain-containing protein [Flammeovirgaceae bacterium SG7u.132]WPO37267.1 adenylate/guanylate cyclase domain-containing protein [Flammeovirgaceae bacterium SG7u.111]